MNNARHYHENKHKWGKIGPSYLLSENGDPSFLLFFFETMLGGEHSGKVSKKIHRELFLRNHLRVALYSVFSARGICTNGASARVFEKKLF